MTTASPGCRRAVQCYWLSISLLLAIAACGPAGPQCREPTGDDDAWWIAVQEYVDLMETRTKRTGASRDVPGSRAEALRERLRHQSPALGATRNDNSPTDGLRPRIVSSSSLDE